MRECDAMLQLLLLRHAKTESDSSSGLDRDRLLDSRGRRDAPETGRYMLDHDLVPDLALVSPALRARETWDLVANCWPAPARVSMIGDLYGAEPSQLLSIIRDVSHADGPEVRRLLVVGHNPGLHEFALGVTGAGDASARQDLAENLPTSGLAVIDFSGDDWCNISFQRGRLARFVSPRLLRERSC
jgi:phosphohistidine phosphatase